MGWQAPIHRSPVVSLRPNISKSLYNIENNCLIHLLISNLIRNMAPKVTVPLDFGIENLHCEFHGNVVLKLQGGEEKRANSLILSYHSSVFVHLFLELHQTELEVEDFAGEAVKRFLGALYSGEILLEKDLFRDVNKLCHVFKVEWLAGRCGDYFTNLVGGVSPSSDYQTLLFLFEEARFCSRVMKCNKFLDLVLEKICSLENRAEIFVEPYMRNYCELETSQLDLMLQITRSYPVFLLKIMKKNLESKGKIFDEASRYLLQNVDLCKCISEDEASFEELFDVLDNATQSSDCNALFVNTLYRRSMKEFKKTTSLNSCSTSNNAVPAPVLPKSATEIPHIFSSFGRIRGLSTQEYLNAAKESPLILNLYMLIEGTWLCNDWLISDMVHEMENIRRKRGWSRISPEFLESWLTPMIPHAVTIKEHGSDLISKEESVRRVGKVVGPNKKILSWNSCTVKDLFVTSHSYAFNFKHPDTNCHLPGKCGFVLKFTPDMKSGQPHKFKVNICFDQEEYPEGLHIHPEVVKADKIHLVPLFEFGQNIPPDMQNCLAMFTWNELGVREVTGEGDSLEWHIGCSVLDPLFSFKMVAFIIL